MKLVTAAQMQAIEQATEEAGISLEDLMEQAGLAVAQEVWLTLGIVAGRRVLVLIGPGNNGGDGLVAARHLAEWEADVVVYLTAARTDEDKHLSAARERGIAVFGATSDDGYASLDEALAGAEIIVDGILGTGSNRALSGVIADVIERVSRARERALPPKLLAIDLPTGIDADSGHADPLALRVDATVALGLAKVGLYTLPGSAYAGTIQTVDIGIPKEAEGAAAIELLSTAWVRERLPQRPLSANKGTFGKVLVVAGSRNYAGATRLCAEACYRAGAGLVTVACPASVQPLIAPALAEVTWLPLDDEDGALAASAAEAVVGALASYNVLLIGPGLGQRASIATLVRRVLAPDREVVRMAVIDADALNALADTPRWHESIAPGVVLTPHPGEMARLQGTTVEAVQADRLNGAMRAAVQWGQVVVLKGAHTIVAAPDGQAAVSPYANAILAAAGTGDVLAGTIAGFLAQGMEPFKAAACGVYVHALAAEEVGDAYADRGMLASELLPAIPRALRTIVHGKAPRPAGPGIADLAGFGGGFEAPGFP